MQEPKYCIGDLVAHIYGQSPPDMKMRVWQIESVSRKESYDHGEHFVRATYAIKDIHSGEKDIAEEASLILLSSADNADKYLKLYSSPEIESLRESIEDVFNTNFSDEDTRDTPNHGIFDWFNILDLGEATTILSNSSVPTGHIEGLGEVPLLTLTKKEKEDMTNELLDRYIDCKRFIEADGKINNSVQEQIDKIEAELKAVGEAVIVQEGR